MPGKAVDVNADTDFSKGHCSHTTNNNPSWWRVDLGSDKVPVSEVHIVNRFLIHTSDFKDYKILHWVTEFLKKTLFIYF